jgi:hypothetical protein
MAAEEAGVDLVAVVGVCTLIVRTWKMAVAGIKSFPA